jgi:hypothetical protein
MAIVLLANDQDETLKANKKRFSSPKAVAENLLIFFGLRSLAT